MYSCWPNIVEQWKGEKEGRRKEGWEIEEEAEGIEGKMGGKKKTERNKE